VGVAGDLRLLFGDNPRFEIFLAGDARGDGDALGDADDLGDGVLRAALDAVRRLVGLFKFGDPYDGANPRVPGDFERLLGELGIDNKLELAGAQQPLFGPPQQPLSPPLLVTAMW